MKPINDLDARPIRQGQIDENDGDTPISPSIAGLPHVNAPARERRFAPI